MWSGTADFSHPRLVIVPPKMAQVCKECGCECHSCGDSNSLDLHHQIEELTSKLSASTSQLVQMEKDFTASHLYADQEIHKLQEEIVKLRDRYDRLYESHKKLSKVNQSLEEKILTVVHKFEEEKHSMTEDIHSLQERMMDARNTIGDLEDENDRYRNDCNVAVQMLQCRPSNFVAQRLNTLPLDLQQRLIPHLSKEQLAAINAKKEEPKQIRVPMPTFPPTAMVYSINEYETVQIEPKCDGGSVPMTLIAKILTQPANPLKRTRRTYFCTKCKEDIVVAEKGVQTAPYHIDNHNKRSTESTTNDALNGKYVHKPRTKLPGEMDI